jgi:hypothetical protein
MSKTPTTTMVAAAAAATTIPDEDTEAAEDIMMIRMITYKTSHVRVVTKKNTFPWTTRHLRKKGNKNSNMVSKVDFKNLFQSSIKEMLTKKENQKKEKDSTYMDEESLDMNIFDILTSKHNEIVSKNDDDSMIITNNLFHFEQTNDPDNCYLKDNNKNNYDEISHPYSKRIKLKHEPEAAPEKKTVQCTADIIVDTELHLC